MAPLVLHPSVLLSLLLPSLILFISATPTTLSSRDNNTTESSAINLNPYPNHPKLTFRSDGTFKITVFSDLHYGEDEDGDWGPVQDYNSTVLMDTVLPSEDPDYVVINGDLITGENTFKENSTDYVNIILAPLLEAHIPFSSTQGNHDNQVNITHLAEIERELSISGSLSYTRTAPSGVGGSPTEGPGTYWVPVYAKQNDTTPALILWFFDSRGGFSPGDNSVANPDWVDATVATWINETRAAMDAAWGEAKTVGRGSLAFVHIPPYAIQAVQANLDEYTQQQNIGLNADVLGDGSTQGTSDESDIGNDQPFYDAVTAIPYLHAIISGHDHGNEWCALEPTRNTVFCFDKHAGYGGYSDDGWDYGVRNVVFTSTNASEPPESWIRYENGTVVGQVTLGGGFQA